MKTRRNVLAAALVAACFCALGASLRSQIPDMSPQQSRPGHEPPANEGPPMPDAEKKVLEENDKNMKKKVERLYQLASELKDQVDKTDSSKVLSLDLIKKAEEIEKLAHDIKNRSKG